MSGYGMISEVSSSVGASCCDKLNFLAFIQSMMKQAAPGKPFDEASLIRCITAAIKSALVRENT